ncbi:MAG: SPASM domain-containing protein [Hungatella sp.]|nr:SPASM domain-containing protein [Hungatella sp.]
MKYISSYYNFQVTRNDGTLLLYNTRTGSLIFIDKIESAEKIKEMLNEPDKYLETDDFNVLRDNGFIILKDCDEIHEVAKGFSLVNNSKSSLSITILPTIYCNFNCPYCFVVEDGKFTSMKQRIYNAIYNLILRYIKNYSDKITVTIGWFGGEPMLCVKDMENFMNRLIELEKEYNNITLHGKIVTNGFFLNYDNFLRLYEAGIKNFQVTLDGDKENHDKLRTLKDGNPTFDIIYKNLLSIKNDCKYEDFLISLRGNFLRSNIKSMKQLAQKMIVDFKGDERFNLSFRPVVDFSIKKNKHGVAKDDYCNKQESVKIQEKLFSDMQGYGNKGNRMFNPLPYPINKWCNVNKQNSFIFNPDGLVFACDSVLSDKREAIGVIQEDGTIAYNEKESVWRSSIFQSDKYGKCQICKILPVCLGGCTRQRLIVGKGVCTWTPEIITESLMKYSEKI